jgi:hypothetical protein
MSLFFIYPATGIAEVEQKEYKLSSDPRLAEAKETFEKGQRFMRKGDRNFRGRPGQAQKHFETAEDYFSMAAYHYRELGDKYGIDTSHEVNACESLSRRAHVWVSKSRRARKRPGAGY